MKLTKNELIIEVAKFYKGYITLDKAKELYFIHSGIEVQVIENENKLYVNKEFIENGDFPECINYQNMLFMRDLQESGLVNMVIGSIRDVIQQSLLVSKRDAKIIHEFYLNNYNNLYIKD